MRLLILSLLGMLAIATGPARAEADLERGKGLYATCAACHGADAAGNAALNAPRLNHLREVYVIAQLEKFRNGQRGGEGATTVAKQMAPMAATLPDAAAVRNIAAYIDSLPDVSPAATVEGDAARGRDLFSTCSSCHGQNAQGIWSINAPGLRGTDDWYLVRQLQNYRQGIRGSHPSDLYGKQMNLVSGMLRSEQAVRDVVAYINTLE